MSSDHIVFDETVIRINGQRFWLYAVVNQTRTNSAYAALYDDYDCIDTAFLQELQQKHAVSDAMFLVDHARHLAAALRRAGLRFQTTRYGNRNAVERAFREVKRRTSSFSNSFSHAQSTTAETWLQAFAVWWIHLTKHDAQTSVGFLPDLKGWGVHLTISMNLPATARRYGALPSPATPMSSSRPVVSRPTGEVMGLVGPYEYITQVRF
jgi:putative transposase